MSRLSFPANFAHCHGIACFGARFKHMPAHVELAPLARWRTQLAFTSSVGSMALGFVLPFLPSSHCWVGFNDALRQAPKKGINIKISPKILYDWGLLAFKIQGKPKHKENWGVLWGPKKGRESFRNMALDRFAAYILAQIFIFAQFYNKTCSQKSVAENVPKCIYVFHKSSSFPRKRAKKCCSSWKK